MRIWSCITGWIRDLYLVMWHVFEDNGKNTTGRVVAVAGDTVDITKDGLKINGADQVSQDIYFDTTQFKDGVDFPITVGEGQVFILGDNRPQASDSRTFGCIDLNDVKRKSYSGYSDQRNLIPSSVNQI